MSISNAHRWLEICEKQAKLLENLSETFPQRQREHTQLSQSWRQVAAEIVTEQPLK